MWILAALRNHTFFSLAELNKAVAEKLVEFNDRKFKKMDGCRRVLFETIEKPAMKPLPLQAYEYAEWKKATVNIDYHITAVMIITTAFPISFSKSGSMSV